MTKGKWDVRKLVAAGVLLVVGLVSFFWLAKTTADPAFHAASIAALDEKKVTVMELTAATAAGSVAISAVPGDATTPIANQISELSGYLLIVVGAIMLASLAMSFVLPSIFAKIMILAPIALSICETAKFEKSSKPAAGLFCAIFVSSFFLSNFFTTGNSNVQVMFAFAKTPFTFFEWMKFTSVWMIIMTLGTYLFIVGFFGPKGKLDLSKDYIQRQIEALPPMSANDKKAAVILIISVILWMTESLHGISALAVTILAYCAFTATGISTPDEFKAKVDWTLVIVIGGILSVASFISSLGIATYLSGTLGPVLAPIVINKWFFIPVLTVLVFLSRYIIVSQIGTLTIFIAIFQALVVPLGYHPMVVVFCSNMIIQLWATNYNNVLIKPAYAMTRNRLVEHKDVAPMAYALFVLSIIAYVASIPLWTSMGMLG